MDNAVSRQRAEAWLKLDDDPETRTELELLLETNESELALRFSGRLAFGTAGLRGLQGAGPTRMNRVVVRQTTAGLADYLVAEVPRAKERGVVIGYDARVNSDVFAAAAAAVLVDRGFSVFLSDGVCPTPIVAYGVLDLSAAAGIVVTASHNPPAYNGYKVFWENGAQIIAPRDAGIAKAIETAEIRDRVLTLDLNRAVRDGKLRRFGEDLERRYRLNARSLMRNRTIAQNQSITIAYTPLHGVGAAPLGRLLKENGFDTVIVEPSQAEPDGSFPTVEFPNPEEPGAMDRVFALANKVDADIVLANDPDADRLAVAIPEGDGFRLLTGDQVGALLADYLLSGFADQREPLLITTVVSSQLLSMMAKARGARFREVLTGFKWIANTAIDMAASAKLVLGYEEALGYCAGEMVRDKDGLSAALLFAEFCAVTLHRGQLISDRLESIYRDHGAFVTRQVSLVREGESGKQEIAQMMKRARTSAPTSIDGRVVVETTDLEDGSDELPAADAIIFRLKGDGRVIMRPSGTEPKLKCYYEVREDVGSNETVKAALGRAQQDLEKLIDAHQASLKAD